MIKTLRTAAWLAVIAITAAYAGFWAQHHWQSSGRTVPDAPILAAEITLTGLDGQTRKLSDYRGKLVLVNFWATWCSPCVAEMPLLMEAQNTYGPRGLQVLGPALDDRASIEAFVQKLGIRYPVGVDYAQADAAMKQFANEQGALPYSVLISPDGEVIQTLLGGLNKEQLKQLLEPQLPISF